MTDQAIENAINTRKEMAEKIAAAEATIAEWRARMERAERFIQDWEEFSGEKVTAVTDVASTTDTASSAPKKKPKNPKKEEVAEAARMVLLDNGSPMSRDDLFTALADKGVEIHGQNPPVVLQTMLWRMQERIVHLKGHGYWPADTNWPSADYDPDAMGAVNEGKNDNGSGESDDDLLV